MLTELYPHQEKAVEELSNGKVLVGGVGTGKTITALVYFYVKVMGGTIGDFGSIEVPMDIYVFTTARKRDDLDWQHAALQLGMGTRRDSSVAGVQLTVDSYNNIEKYSEIRNAFIILDEQRMVGSGAWTKAFLKMAKVNKWIMLSATPGDIWEDYIPLFIANGFYKNRTEFKREHCVYSYFGRYPKLERYLNVGRLIRQRNSILVEMPYDRHTTRHIHTTPVSYDKDLFERVVKKRWHVYENRPLKDVSELFSVMRKVVNSDPSRIQTLWNLMKDHPRLIVFYNFDYELEILRTLIDQSTGLNGTSTLTSHCTHETTCVCNKKENLKRQRKQNLCTTHISKPLNYKDERLQKPPKSDCDPPSQMIIPKKDGKHEPSLVNLVEADSNVRMVALAKQECQIAEWNGHNHDPVPTSERWVYLVQYVAGAEAWNCTATNAVVFYSLTYSYKNFEQAQGRIDRLDTPFSDLHYYIFTSDSPIDKAVVKALKNKKSFNEREYYKTAT